MSTRRTTTPRQSRRTRLPTNLGDVSAEPLPGRQHQERPGRRPGRRASRERHSLRQAPAGRGGQDQHDLGRRGEQRCHRSGARRDRHVPDPGDDPGPHHGLQRRPDRSAAGEPGVRQRDRGLLRDWRHPGRTTRSRAGPRSTPRTGRSRCPRRGPTRPTTTRSSRSTSSRRSAAGQTATVTRTNTATFSSKTRLDGIVRRRRTSTATSRIDLVHPRPDPDQGADRTARPQDATPSVGDSREYVLTASNAASRPTLHDTVVVDCVPTGLEVTVLPSAASQAPAADGDACAYVARHRHDHHVGRRCSRGRRVHDADLHRQGQRSRGRRSDVHQHRHLTGSSLDDGDNTRCQRAGPHLAPTTRP